MLAKRNKVLIVDDQPNIIQTLKHCFSAKGYEVNVACNRKDALGFLNKIKVDLVLLDVKMPGISVAELARIIKEKYPQAKIILISGHADANQQSASIPPPPTQDSFKMQKDMLLVKTIILLAVKDLSRQRYANN
jgi:DNA-binding NtrC family response regulator